MGMSGEQAASPLVDKAEAALARAEAALAKAEAIADKIPEVFGGYTSSIQTVTGLASWTTGVLGVVVAIVSIVFAVIAIWGWSNIKKDAVEAANARIAEHVRSEDFINHVEDSVRLRIEQTLNQTTTEPSQQIHPLPGVRS